MAVLSGSDAVLGSIPIVHVALTVMTKSKNDWWNRTKSGWWTTVGSLSLAGVTHHPISQFTSIHRMAIRPLLASYHTI
ncbi:Uncharacterized protein HZ326_31405 [Fusarium oxysporum f. sp. albedinis]|nr:Uncharacterized protein HZ326_31405 [Fusarium oxysporum f. sp. albedinis]